MALRFTPTRAPPALAFNTKKNRQLSEAGQVINRKARAAYGVDGSAREKSRVDSYGNPVPWMTYPAVECLSQFDFSKNTVFEWGSGNSSAWFSRRFASVISVESEARWYDMSLAGLNDNQTLLLREFDRRGNEEDAAVRAFADVILEQDGGFDVISNDGKLISRPRCTDNAIEKLNPGGLIIFDNSDWFPAQCEKLRKAGFLQVDFHGNGPLNNYTWTTSIFFEPRPDCLLMTNPQAFSRVSKAGRSSHKHVLGMASP